MPASKALRSFSLPFRKLEDADNLRQLMVAALDRIPPDMAPQDARRELTFALSEQARAAVSYRPRWLTC
jgi:hypothetical protein